MKIGFKNSKNYKNIMIFLLTIMPIVDCLNGYFQNNFLSLIGPLYRFLMIIVSSVIMITKGKRRKVFWVFYIAIYFLVHDLLFILFDYMNNDLYIITERTLKYIYTILLIETIYALINKNDLKVSDIDKIFGNLSWLYPILLIIPKLIGASGTNMYSDSGYKGFYYSGNSISIAMVVCLFVSIDFLYKKPSVTNTLRAVLCLAVQLLIGAKANYIFAILILFYYAYKSLNILKLKNIKTIIILGVIAVIGYWGLKYWFVDEIASIYARQKYIFAAYENDFFRYLTSNRSIRIKDQFEQFTSSLFNIMFGMGYRKTKEHNFVEMDYWDLLFRYGIVISIGLFFYYLEFLKKAFKNQREYFILLSIMLAYAMLAGHVFCDAMSGTFLALIIGRTSCENYYRGIEQTNLKCRTLSQLDI